jgi:transposase
VAKVKRAENNRRFLDAVLWVVRAGALWCDLPPDLGDWSYTHRRFLRWRNRGGLRLDAVINAPDFEWLIRDVGHVKAYPPMRLGLGEETRKWVAQNIFLKLHLAVDAQGMPVRVVITGGTTIDCTQASKRVEGIKAEHLLAGKAYDTDAILKACADSCVQGCLTLVFRCSIPCSLYTRSNICVKSCL